MKTVFIYHTSAVFRDYIRKKVAPSVELVFLDVFREEYVQEETRDADIIVGFKFSQEILSSTEAKYLHIPWTGTDTVDFTALKNELLAFTLLNSHDNSKTVAEHALALLLAVARKIPLSDKLLRKGDWNLRLDNSTINLTGKTFLFFGYGSIMRDLIDLVSVFDPNILVIRQSSSPASVHETFRVVNMHDAIPRADFIIIGLPLTPKTENLIGKRELELMKPSSILVNVARGKLIEVPAVQQHGQKTSLLE